MGVLQSGSVCYNINKVFFGPAAFDDWNTRWRSVLSGLSKGWTQRITGSSNIGPLCLVIALAEGTPGEKAKALELLHEYCDAAISGGLWHLKEQGSWTYSGLTFGALIGARMVSGDVALNLKLRTLLDQWMALAHVNAHATPEGVLVLVAGFRAWNHGADADMHHLYQVAAGLREPWKVVRADASNWTVNARFTTELRESFARVKADPWAAVTCGVFRPWYFAQYADGCTASYIGEDEPELAREFQGISTPAKLLCIGTKGAWVAYPKCPNPLNGDVDMRNDAVGSADLDGDAQKGWHLSHSTIGAFKGQQKDPVTGRYEQDIPRPTTAPLVLWKRLDSTGLHDLLAAAPPAPAPTPEPNPAPKPHRRGCGAVLALGILSGALGACSCSSALIGASILFAAGVTAAAVAIAADYLKRARRS